jgi:hypothetical protein
MEVMHRFGPVRSRRVASFIVLASMLFAQTVYAAQSCIDPFKQPAVALSQAQESDCHGAKQPPNANCCLAQCVQGNQTTAQPPLLALDMPPALPLLIVTRAEDIAEWHADIFERIAGIPTGPPASIRYCSLLL